MTKRAFLGGTVFAMVTTAVALSLVAATAHAQTIINNNVTVVNGGSATPGDGDPGQSFYWRNDNRKMEAWLYTDRASYRPGTGVRLRVTLTNIASGSTSYQLPRYGEYVITITDTRTNRIVWRRDRAQSRGATLQLAAGGTAQWIEIWDQRDTAGNMVPMGAYRVDVKVIELLPISAPIFLSDRAVSRAWTGAGNGNGADENIVTLDPATGPNPVTPPNPGDASGVGNGAYLIGGGNRDVTTPSAPVAGTLTLSKTVAKPGDEVKFVYLVTNTSREPVTLTFGSGQTFDVTATRATRTPDARFTPVWRLSDGMMFAQMVRQMTLKPGEQQSFGGTWRVGTDLTPGQVLNMSAFLTTVGSAMNGGTGAARARVTVN